MEKRFRSLRRAKSKGKREKPLILIVATGHTEKKFFEDRFKAKGYSTVVVVKNSEGDSNPISVIRDYERDEDFLRLKRMEQLSMTYGLL